jgi:two-component system sensor histidine kinase YesM
MDKSVFKAARQRIGSILHNIPRAAAWFRNIKIQVRLILLFIILSVLPLLISGIDSYNKSSDAIKTKISTYSVQVMSQISENIGRELARLENDSIEIGFSNNVQYVLQNYDRLTEWDILDIENRMKEDLVKKFSFLHDVSDVLLYTNNQDMIIAYGDKGFKLKLKKKFLDPYLEAIEKNAGAPVWAAINTDSEESLVKFATSAEQLSKSNGILLGRAVKSLDTGEIIGALLIRTNERYFLNVYANTDIGTGADIFLLDSEGVVVSSRNPEIRITEPYREKQLISGIRSKQKGEGGPEKRGNVFHLQMAGMDHLVAYAPVDKARWYVVGTIPFSYLNSEPDKIKSNSIIVGIICFFGSVLLSAIFSMSISRPLKKLVRAMNEAKRGNLSVSVTDDGKDEIGEVANHFNSMVTEIKNLLANVENKEKQKRNAELRALQAQINPHFLSNTLNTAKWLAGIQKAENVESILTSMINLLRVSIGKGNDFITIREEMEYIRDYINIQEYRYYNKFKVNYEVEEEILEYKIPRFLLQPVVENSIIHGIEPMEGQGLVIVKGFVYKEDLRITVTDNGVGIPEEKIRAILESGSGQSRSRFSGIGISNVQERIGMYFGEQYGLYIKSVLNLYTTIELTLPIIR